MLMWPCDHDSPCKPAWNGTPSACLCLAPGTAVLSPCLCGHPVVLVRCQQRCWESLTLGCSHPQRWHASPFRSVELFPFLSFLMQTLVSHPHHTWNMLATYSCAVQCGQSHMSRGWTAQSPVAVLVVSAQLAATAHTWPLKPQHLHITGAAALHPTHAKRRASCAD